MRAWLWLSVGMGIVVACGGTDRDGPRGGTGPTSGPTLAGVGGSTSTGGAGGTVMLPDCVDPGVTCEATVYFGDCTASPGTAALWEFLSYEVVIPELGDGDAMVEFAIRSANTEEDLASEAWRVASVAEMGSEKVFKSNPIHLDEVLETGTDRRDYLELRIKLVDATDGRTPSVDSLDLQFSCVEI